MDKLFSKFKCPKRQKLEKIGFIWFFSLFIKHFFHCQRCVLMNYTRTALIRTDMTQQGCRENRISIPIPTGFLWEFPQKSTGNPTETHTESHRKSHNSVIPIPIPYGNMCVFSWEFPQIPIPMATLVTDRHLCIFRGRNTRQACHWHTKS